jgi:hypothetical protein
MSTTYNGWANIETWRVQLHLANDLEAGNFILEAAKLYETGRTPKWDSGEPLAMTFVEFVRGHVWERVGANVVGGDTFEMLARDTVAAALERVDWNAIAAAWMEGARRELKPKGAAT